MPEFNLEEIDRNEEEACRYIQISEDGYITCSRIKFGENIISKQLCREVCPLAGKKCMYLRFSLRREELFSAIGFGGRRTEITISSLACSLHKKKLDNISICQDCPDKVYDFVGEELLKEGLRLLVEGLGEERAKEFLRLFLEKKVI